LLMEGRYCSGLDRRNPFAVQLQRINSVEFI